MALPVQDNPLYDVEVPSSGEKIKYRPFLIKEEKALLIAQQSEDSTTMVNTLKGVIESCTLGKVDIEKLALFDLEYLFTQIRAKSVGEVVDLLFSCDEDHGEDNKKAKVKISIDLTNIKVQRNDKHSKKIELFGDTGVVMKYPSFEMLKAMETLEGNDIDTIFNVVASCIDYIYSGEEIYYAKETPKEEILQFLNNLTQEQFKKLQAFFETMPKLTTDVKYKCPVCDKQHDKKIEGLNNFF